MWQASWFNFSPRSHPYLTFYFCDMNNIRLSYQDHMSSTRLIPTQWRWKMISFLLLLNMVPSLFLHAASCGRMNLGSKMLRQKYSPPLFCYQIVQNPFQVLLALRRCYNECNVHFGVNVIISRKCKR